MRRLATDKYEATRDESNVSIPGIALLTQTETIEAVAILVIALGLAGLAILILFSKKKI